MLIVMLDVEDTIAPPEAAELRDATADIVRTVGAT